MFNYTKQVDTIKLVALDKAMRSARSFKASVQTRLDFYLYALRNGHVNDLNNLAEEYAPDSMLSERSLDRVFEDGNVSTEVVRQLVIMAGNDASFSELLRKDMGDSFFEKNAPTLDLFAAATPA